MGKKTHKTALSPWDFVTPPEDRATAIANMHRKIGKDPTWSCADILADQAGRQAGRQMCYSQFTLPQRSNNTTQIRI